MVAPIIGTQWLTWHNDDEHFRWGADDLVAPLLFITGKVEVDVDEYLAPELG
jgi:hypothetical protein